MPNKNFRARRDSTSSEEEETAGDSKEKIEELKLLQKTRQRQHGIDAYALAIGEQDTGPKPGPLADNDPWKSKTGGLVDMKRILEKRGNEIVKNMNSNFAKETNQRDEDAEMQKFIEEQLRLKKEQEQKSQLGTTGETDASASPVKFKRPEDALFDVPKYLIENTSKHKSEESLSEQMLSGIPEVDLGVQERIRNIEETERAKQKLVSGRHSRHSSSQKNTTEAESQYAPHNQAVNFVQHKRFDDALINPDHMVRFKVPRTNPNQKPDQDQPVVGDAPKHELLKQAAHNAQIAAAQALHNHHHGRHGKQRRQADTGGGGGASAAPTPSQPAPEEMIEVLEKKILAADASDPAADQGATTSGGHHHKPSAQRSGGGHKRQQPVERATDDYCLERFKKNMRHGRSSKIKIA